MCNLLEKAKARGLTARVVFKDESISRIVAEEKPEVILGMTCSPKIR